MTSTFTVRRARVRDLSAMVAIAEARRRAYEILQPVLWKKSRRSASVTWPFFGSLLFRRRTVVLVAVEGTEIAGFLIARVIRAPPVYDAGGGTALIDDFDVAAPALWTSAGTALLEALRAVGSRSGWQQLIVVAAEGDEPKAAFLRAGGLGIASNWWTQPL